MIQVKKGTFSKQIQVKKGSVPNRVANVKPRLWLRIIGWIIGFPIAALAISIVLVTLGFEGEPPLGAVGLSMGLGGLLGDWVVNKIHKKMTGAGVNEFIEVTKKGVSQQSNAG